VCARASSGCCRELGDERTTEEYVRENKRGVKRPRGRGGAGEGGGRASERERGRPSSARAREGADKEERKAMERASELDRWIDR
jgi:hypothetical protein